MPEFKLNGKTYSGSTSYASAIDYTEADGSKTTVQDKISELDENISEQNKKFDNAEQLLYDNFNSIQNINIPNYNNYNALVIQIFADVNYGGKTFIIPKSLYYAEIPFIVDTKNLSSSYNITVSGFVKNGVIYIKKAFFTGWDSASVRVYGLY